MIQLDPMIAVKDVSRSADWYHQIFGFTNAHGGDHFAVLTTREKEIVLCLHAWEADQHPTMTQQDVIAGNGLLLYFRTSNWLKIKENLDKIDWPIEEEIHQYKG